MQCYVYSVGNLKKLKSLGKKSFIWYVNLQQLFFHISKIICKYKIFTIYCLLTRSFFITRYHFVILPQCPPFCIWASVLMGWGEGGLGKSHGSNDQQSYQVPNAEVNVNFVTNLNHPFWFSIYVVQYLKSQVFNKTVIKYLIGPNIQTSSSKVHGPSKEQDNVLLPTPEFPFKGPYLLKSFLITWAIAQ